MLQFLDLLMFKVLHIGIFYFLHGDRVRSFFLVENVVKDVAINVSTMKESNKLLI